jgi:hypothetical protein
MLPSSTLILFWRRATIYAEAGSVEMDEAATQAPSNVSPECALLALFFSLDSRADLLDVTWDYLLDIPLLIPHGEVSLKGWEELEPFLLEEVAAQRRERLKQRLRAAVREKVIGDWIARYVKGLSQDEEKTLKSRIETDLEQDSKKELGEYLELVLTDGIAKAEQKKKKEQRAGYPGHLWVAILGIAKLVVAFKLFAAASSKFETIVFAMLALIYVSVEGAYRASRYFTALSAIGADNQFIRIFRALKIYEYSREHQALIDQHRETKKLLPRMTIRFYLASAFSAVIWVLAVWKLTTSLLQ